MKLRNQAGSGHLIIIIVLVVALLAALGWIFWRNLTASSTKTDISAVKPATNTAKISNPKADTSLLQMNSVYKNGLSLNYPRDWTVLHVAPIGDNPPKDDGTTVDAYILTSPDKSIDLSVVQSSGGGRGGYCMREEEPLLDSYSYQASANWKGGTYADYVYEYEGKYLVGQVFALQSNAEKIKAGNSRCEVGYLGVVKTEKVVQSSTNIEIVTNISRHGAEGPVVFPSLNEATTYLTTDNAEDVKAILLSIK